MRLCAECGHGHRFMKMKPLMLLAFLASFSATSLAQSCISLSGSTQCPGFNLSSISTSPELTAQLYVFHPLRKLSALTYSSPFLAFVSNTQQFDDRLKVYTTSTYVQLKYVELLSLSKPSTYLKFRYQQLLGCNNINLKNTTNLYARYTTSVICNSIVQNSIRACSLSGAKARPLCAETCVSGLCCHFDSILRPFSRLSKPPARSK